MKYKYRLAVFLGVIFTMQPAQAHHAWGAIFLDERMDIEGYVTEFNLKNPHVNIMLSVTDEAGVETEWMATGPAGATFRGAGWSENTVQSGQYLRLTGWKSRTGAPMLLLLREDIRSGKLLEVDPNDGSTIRQLLGTMAEDNAPAEPASLPLTLSDGRVNLSATWTNGPRERTPPTPFNEVGAALQADYDPLYDDPAFTTCSLPGLVRQARTIHPMRIMQYDDRVIFEYEEHGGFREIFLDQRGPTTVEHSRFGHPIARYEGDELIIESSHLLANLGDPNGNALSNQTTTIESYRRVDNPEMGPMIEMRLAVSDPGHLNDIWNIRWRKRYAPEGIDFIPVDCKLPLPGSQ